MRDLWPEDIGPISDLKAPATILREQASLLGKKTNNLVEVEVVRFEPIRPEEFLYAFLIVVPALDNYRYKLFTISYNINIYPVTISVDGEIRAEINPADPEGKLTAESESEFVDILKKIFSARKTRKVIGALLSMISYGQEGQIVGLYSNNQ